MIETLITSKTRIKLLLRLFLKEHSKSYLRQMEKEFGESVNAVRLELNRFEDAGLVTGEFVGGKKYFQANTQHPLYNDINSILKKFVGIDKIIERITSQIGDLDSAYLSGSFALGLDSDIIELLLVGKNLDDSYIRNLVVKAEGFIERKINYLLLSSEQMKNFFANKPVLLIWNKDE
jgi:predicted transcriptional regulator